MRLLLLAAAQAGDPSSGWGIGEIAKQGLLGAVAAMAIGALIWMTKNWKAALEERIVDAKGYASALREQNNAATGLVVETNRSNDSLKNALVELKTEVGVRHGNREVIEKEKLSELIRTVDTLKEKQAELLPEVRQALKGGKG
jgi:hypothetical protein